MYNKNIDFLPIGSVVMLKNGRHRVMIVGYCSIDTEKNDSKLFDYIACFYPEGIFTLDNIIGFNESDIDKIYFKGYSDEEQVKFIGALTRKLHEIVDENGYLTISPQDLIFKGNKKENE